MKTLILYASRHGCAEKCAQKLAELIGGADVADIKAADSRDLSDYETVILGGSIHAGKIQKAVRLFAETQRAALKSKRLGLFLCCMEEGAKADEQFRNAFPADLIGAARAKGLFGGEFSFERMNWLEKALTRKIAKIDASVSKIKDDEIKKFADTIKD